MTGKPMVAKKHELRSVPLLHRYNKNMCFSSILGLKGYRSFDIIINY